MLPLLLRSSSNFLKPFFSRLRSVYYSSSNPNPLSWKKIMDTRTPESKPSRGSSSRGRRRGRVSPRKLSPQPLDESSANPFLSHKSRSPETSSRQQGQTSPERMTGNSKAIPLEAHYERVPFDICRFEKDGVVRLNKSLLELKREQKKCRLPQIIRCRPGMILLKGYICYQEQVKIVQICRELGLGTGGFYQPGYRDGAKLRLHMMCMGKNWDPESRMYEDRRSIDGAIPPKIPLDFLKFVDKALHDSHDFLKKEIRGVNAEEEIPWMSPDICIANFYNNNGKLGLHQDKDESTGSLQKGLPVVSFSIGDTAVFLYGDERDVDKLKSIKLESGDVLIFGGKSRHIFHGVDSIDSDSAPKTLIKETGLKRGGRINLTFRRY